jgi:hypothetical protein
MSRCVEDEGVSECEGDDGGEVNPALRIGVQLRISDYRFQIMDFARIEIME